MFSYALYGKPSRYLAARDGISRSLVHLEHQLDVLGKIQVTGKIEVLIQCDDSKMIGLPAPWQRAPSDHFHRYIRSSDKRYVIDKG
jgi:hypothetical protein